LWGVPPAHERLVFTTFSQTIIMVNKMEMTNKIDINKSVPRERWGEFFDQFSDGNRGRHISIEIIDSELGDAELIQDAPLMAMVYDRPGKGDDLVIEVGQDEVTYAHTIDSPTEVLTGQNSNGVTIAVRISDAAGTQTLIKLPAS
jgi:Family of unknown function (DUF5335)